MADTLNLSTLADDGDGIVVDGTYYPYRPMLRWGLFDKARARSLHQTRADLEAMPEPTEDDGAKYSYVLREIVHLCVPGLAEEMLSALPDAKLDSVLTDFFVRSGELADRVLPPTYTALMRLAAKLASDGWSPDWLTPTQATPTAG